MGKLHSTYRWQKKRAAHLKAEPLCRWCLKEGRVTMADTVHHLVPHRDDPDLFWNGELASLCKEHHDRDAQAIEKGGTPRPRIGLDGWPLDEHHPANSGKPRQTVGTPTSHPDWFRKSHVPLHIVCGPPGSGKSTYVRTHAGPSDLVICFDQIAERMFGRAGADRARVRMTSRQVGDVLRQRNDMLGDLMRAKAKDRWPAAWLIVSEPLADRRQWWADRLEPVEIAVLETPAEVCVARINRDAAAGDRRAYEARDTAFRWWSQYRRREGDTIISP